MLLTEREKNVMRLFIDGRTNSQIAEKLGIKVNTVKAFKSRVLLKYRKFGYNRLQEVTDAFMNLRSRDIESGSQNMNGQSAS